MIFSLVLALCAIAVGGALVVHAPMAAAQYRKTAVWLEDFAAKCEYEELAHRALWDAAMLRHRAARLERWRP